MLTLPPAVRIYVATEPCDLRKQFDGLAALVAQGLQEDPRSGHLYVFRNQRGSHVRILFWDRSGYCLVSKRLEKGTFRVPWRAEEVAGRAHVVLEGRTLISHGSAAAPASHRRGRARVAAAAAAAAYTP